MDPRRISREKKQLTGAPRVCRICGTPLNSYNRSDLCSHGHRDHPLIVEEERGKNKGLRKQNAFPPAQKFSFPPASALIYESHPLTPEQTAYAEILMQEVCQEYDINPVEMRDRTVNRKGVVEARYVFIYIAREDPMLNDAGIATFLRRHRSGVTHAYLRIRFMREKNLALDERIKTIVARRPLPRP